VQYFTVISEEALARGIRRLTALTGLAALEATQLADSFAKRLETLRSQKGETLRDELVKLSANLGNQFTLHFFVLVNAHSHIHRCFVLADEAALPAVRKAHLRDEVENLRNALRDATKNTKSDWLEAAQHYAEKVVVSLAEHSASVHVGVLEVGSFNVGLTNAIKAIREKHDIPVLLLSPDTSKPKGAVTVVAQVPDAYIEKGLKGWQFHAI